MVAFGKSLSVCFVVCGFTALSGCETSINGGNSPYTSTAPANVQNGTAVVNVDENGILLNKNLSDENDFEAVSERETIESDAQRLAENRSLYRIVEPIEVPLRPRTRIPNIVAYALQTTNPVGVQLYERGVFATAERSLIRCHKYQSPARAQEIFLSKGGPKRDRLGLDHDGDGFACSWDPTPFRLALSGT